MISSTFAINTFDEENHPITQLYGDKPTQEHVLELAKSKGYTYQRKGKGQSHNKQVPSERYKSGLNMDWVAWINNIKMSAPILELLKIPSQRTSFFRALGVLQQEYNGINH